MKDKINNSIKENRFFYLILFLSAFIGGCLGYLSFDFNLNSIDINKFILLVIIIIISIFIHILIHELGHLIFGLLSGYKFSSFRVGNLMLVKFNDKFILKKFSLLGTVGQCLMSPPSVSEENFPFIFYNIGGSLLNLLISIIFLLLNLTLATNSSYISYFFNVIIVVGFYIGLTNIIPIKFQMINNDGKNLINLLKSKNAIRAFKSALEIDTLSLQDVRIKDMPQELFYELKSDVKDDYITNFTLYHKCIRLMDEHKFTDVKKFINTFIYKDIPIVNIHKRMIICDLIFCELIEEDDNKLIEKLLTKDQLKFLELMKNYPQVLRTNYLINMYYYKNTKKAKSFIDNLKKLEKSYPEKVVIESEKDLIKVAEDYLKRI